MNRYVKIIGELFIISLFANKNLNIKMKSIYLKGLLPGLLPGVLASVYWVTMNYITDSINSFLVLGLIILPGCLIQLFGVYLFGLKQDKMQMVQVLNKLKLLPRTK